MEFNILNMTQEKKLLEKNIVTSVDMQISK